MDAFKLAQKLDFLLARHFDVQGFLLDLYVDDIEAILACIAFEEWQLPVEVMEFLHEYDEEWHGKLLREFQDKWANEGETGRARCPQLWTCLPLQMALELF